jgi:uncharacterized protein
MFNLGFLASDGRTAIEVAQQALFGRHCAIVGTTGGGKSWTVSKCLEEITRNKGKAIIIDATGEYSSFDEKEKVSSSAILGNGSYFHYSNLSIDDIFMLLRPGLQVQAPKLLDAIRSLKLVKILEDNIDDDFIQKNEDGSFKVKINEGLYEEIRVSGGCIIKEKERKRPYNRVYRHFIEEIENESVDFDITKLPEQLTAECVWDNEKNQWGNRQESHLNNCISLILRANNMIQNGQINKIFGFKKKKHSKNELITLFRNFFDSDDSLFRVSFESVGFDFQVREILANAFGKFLLSAARNKQFQKRPIILFIDEAHQYLNKHIKDEYFELTRLSSFDQIAKECRKYGLFLCLATQMPRDIPAGTLSQIGTFIVHRLINPNDKDAIENACSAASKNATAFLPILGEGEAILMGVDFPMPVILKINAPTTEPNSRTPQFSIYLEKPNPVK